MKATANSPKPPRVVALAFQLMWDLEKAANVAEVGWLAEGTPNESSDTLRVIMTDGSKLLVSVAPLNAQAMSNSLA